MLIGFIGSQSGMTPFQREELGKILTLKGCSEFIFSDLHGAPTQAADVAVEVGIELFTIHPVQDVRKRTFFQDPRKASAYSQVLTPYIHRTFMNKEIKIRWDKPRTYTAAYDEIIKESAELIAAPKEFKFSVRSAVWMVIKKVWQLKKDNIIIIPPIMRPEDEDISKSQSTSGLSKNS